MTGKQATMAPVFATVGTQLPFDRLLLALDAWASTQPRGTVLAQTGRTDTRFGHMTCVENLDQADFAQAFQVARVIVAHAGMGTILSASQMGKPVILMARRKAFGEHRNDHQIDTAAEMSSLANVTVVEDAASLALALDQILARPPSAEAGSDFASAELIGHIRQFLFGSGAP